jgi:hypothetical protein
MPGQRPVEPRAHPSVTGSPPCPHPDTLSAKPDSKIYTELQYLNTPDGHQYLKSLVLGAALDAPRRQVFASGEYVKPSFYGDVFDLPEPSSVDDLTEQEQYWEFMGTSGTHSIIDVLTVVPADFTGEEFGTIRPLSDALRRTVRRHAAESRRLHASSRFGAAA